MDSAWDDRYTGFTPGLPEVGHRCRFVRDRRYRAGTTGGLSGQEYRRTVSSIQRFLAQHPPPEPPRWVTTKSFVLGATYIASAVASGLAYGSVIASVVFVAMVTWAAVGSFLFPVDLTCDEAAGVVTPPAVRIEAVSYRMGGRRRVPRRSNTHRRHGRRMGSKGYLNKQLKKERDRSEKRQEGGLASVRGGAPPDKVCVL